MDETILGYQYSPETSKFVGAYQFPNNLDKADIHLPPNTTLDAPPSPPSGQAAFWRDGQWVVEEDADAPAGPPPITDYGMLTQGFLDWMQTNGYWTEEDQQKRDAALAALAAEAAAAAEIVDTPVLKNPDGA